MTAQPDYDFNEYKARLQTLVQSALANYAQRKGERASLRKLVQEATGSERQYTAVYKWLQGKLHQEIRAESFSLLCAIDPENRDPIALDAYLKGIAVEDLPEGTLQIHVAALSQENAALKKRQAQMFALATA